MDSSRTEDAHEMDSGYVHYFNTAPHPSRFPLKQNSHIP